MSVLTKPWRILDELETPSLEFYGSLTEGLPVTVRNPTYDWRWRAIEYAWDHATLWDRLVVCLREVGIAEAVIEIRASLRRARRRLVTRRAD